MRNIDITQILSTELKSRERVSDLKLFIENSGEKNVSIDFASVRFATRSFIDEFYNTFIKNSSSLPFKVDIQNVPSDINAMLSAVGRTQVKTNTISPTFKVRSFKSVDEAIKYMAAPV